MSKETKETICSHRHLACAWIRVVNSRYSKIQYRNTEQSREKATKKKTNNKLAMNIQNKQQRSK